GPVTVSEYQRVDLQSPLSPPYIQAPTDICPTGHSRIATSCEYSTFHWSITHGTFKPNGTSGVFGSDPNSCSVDFEPDGTGDVTVTVDVTSGPNCSATNSVTIPVHDFAPPAIYAPDAFCAGQYAGVSTDSANSLSVKWSVTNATVDPWQPDYYSNFTFTPTGAGPVVVTLLKYGNGGCNTTSTKTVPLTSPTQPQIVVDSVPSVCQGTQMHAHLSNAASFQQIYWYATNGSSSGSTYGPDFTFYPDGSGQTSVTVQAYDANGCNGTATQSVPLNGGAAPPIASDAATCIGAVRTASVPAGFDSYSWQITNGVI